MAVTVDTLVRDNKLVHSQHPAVKCVEITPNDDNYLADGNDVQYHTRGIMVDVAGTVPVIFAQDTSVVTLTLLAGVLYPFAIKKVNTGGTATGIKGFV